MNEAFPEHSSAPGEGYRGVKHSAGSKEDLPNRNIEGGSTAVSESRWIATADSEGCPVVFTVEEELLRRVPGNGMGRMRSLYSKIRNFAERIAGLSVRACNGTVHALKIAERGLVRFRRREAPVPWEVPLRDSKAEIDRLNAAMEKEFLSITAQLQDFYGEARVISDLSSSVATQLSGDRITATIEGLCGILDRVKQLESNSRLGAETLNEILGMLDAIQESGMRFRGITRILGVLCVTVQIESARFGNDDIGFDTLAGDIRKLALDIESKFTGILNHSHELGRVIEETVSKIIGADTGRSNREKLILDNIRLALQSLRERHLLSSGTAAGVAERYRKISGNIAEIVTSVQFHDITRQRFEHVGNALVELIPGVAGLEGEKGGRLASLFGSFSKKVGPGPVEAVETANPPATPGRMAGICKLQERQLGSSTDSLVEAVESIVGNLRAASSNISDMSREAQQIAGVCDEGGHCFLAGLETTLAPVTAALHEHVTANRQLSEAMRSVAAAVSDMATFVKSIEKIGFEINLIALNAIVKAEHIGERGAALGVLAEAVHDLALDTRTQSAQVSDLFKSIATAAEGIVPEIEGGKDAPGTVATDLTEDLKLHIETIQHVNEELLDLTSRMDAAGKALALNLEGAASNIGIHRQVADVTESIRTNLGELRAHILQVSGRAGEDMEDDLNELASTYTMESERTVHHSVTDGREQPLDAAPAAVVAELPQPLEAEKPDGGEEEDLGDNVELF